MQRKTCLPVRSQEAKEGSNYFKYSAHFMNREILYDQKWFKLLQRSFLFQYFPFVDFVLAAGSMALGDVNENSDFDVIVAAKNGRLYTARFFCLAIYKLVGWRRKKNKTA
ncbi:MAG: hypothetical protein AAB847_01950, partial [Patescibacteria group bacterium]